MPYLGRFMISGIGRGSIAVAALSVVATASLATTSLAATSIGAVPAAAAMAKTGADGVPAASRVFVIVGENTSLSELTRRRAPYIAGTLKLRSAWLVGYRALASSSSTGDYIEMTSGQSIKCERNDTNPVNPNTDKAICHQAVNNIFNQLQHKGVSWKDWEESMPHPCAFYDDGTDWAGDVYGAHHNPAIYYDDIEGARYFEDFSKAPQQVCISHDVPMGTTAKDNTSTFDRELRNGTVPRFNFIVPNDCENGHDLCGGHNSVGQFDAFVQREVTRIVASPAWNSRSVIDITWDEQGDGSPHNPQVGSIWYGAQVKPGVYHGRWSHASLLRTIEDAFRLPHLRGAKTARSTAAIWR